MTVPGDAGDAVDDARQAHSPTANAGRARSVRGSTGRAHSIPGSTGQADSAGANAGDARSVPEAAEAGASPSLPGGSDRVPKYYRIKQRLLQMTEARPPGTAMPAERLLAVEFRTSRTTVRKALQELVSEGRLDRIQGKGTFIARPKVYRTLQLTSYTEDMRAQGLSPASHVLDIGYVPADENLAAMLEVEPGAKILRIERLRLAGGEPMAVETTHLSAARFPGLRRNLSRYTSLYATLSEVYGVHLAEADETIETCPATPREAALLATDVGLPMLLLSRHSRDSTGTPVEWVHSVYRGSRYRFTAVLRRPGP